MAGEVVNGSVPLKGHMAGTGLAVSCSVCLEAVSEDGGERSIAKLKCGHHFHLDCIGSAFNAKGRMQCPNCRQVEHGQWLYASGCFLQHEDLVDDFTFEEEVDAYGGTANLQFSPAPWCPHQGSFAQISLTFEELDNFNSNGFMEPMVNLRPGSRVSAQICPYLAAQGLSLGPHSEDFIGPHVGHHPHRPSRNLRRGSTHRALEQQLAATSSGMPTSYEGSSQSYNPFLQPNGNRQHAFGFLVGSPQAIHTGVTQGTNMGSGQIFGQMRNMQDARNSLHLQSHSVSAARNSFMSSRRSRPNEITSILHRAAQATSSDIAWPTMERVHRAHEHSPLLTSNTPMASNTPLMSSSTIGQTLNPIVGGEVTWASATADSQVDPWTTGIYVPQPSIGGSSQWWAWAPPANSHGQRLVVNGTPTSGYHHQEGQFYGAGLFARSRAAPVSGFSEQPSEGSYGWGFSGF